MQKLKMFFRSISNDLYSRAKHLAVLPYQVTRWDTILIKNHTLLEWLTPEQALRSLQKQADPQMTLQDLFSHCIQSNCYAYIKVGEKGVYPEAFSQPSSLNFRDVYGTGYQRVLNPEGLLITNAPFSAVLLGDVLIAPDPDAEIISGIEWHAEISSAHSRTRFKRVEIEQLAADILSSGTGGPSERSILMAVGALLELLTASGKMNKAGIEKEIVDRHPKKRGLGERTLQKIFADAEELLKSSD